VEFDSPYIFVHAPDARHPGKPVLDVKNVFHTALEEASIENSTWHDFGDEDASRPVMAGVSPSAAAELPRTGLVPARWDGDTVGRRDDEPERKDVGERSGQCREPRLQHVIERFTPVDADTISWEATITDPIVYTRRFTIGMPFKRQPSELLEVACREGDRDLPILSTSATSNARSRRPPRRRPECQGVGADYVFQSVESAARFFRTYFFCCASASRTLSANDFSAFATIALNASVSMHVTQSGLTGSAGFNGRPRFCR
jgi:hypothetical protein